MAGLLIVMNKQPKGIIKNIIIIFLLTLATAGAFGAYLTLTVEEPPHEIAFAAADQPTVPVYVRTDNGMEEIGSITRGSRVNIYRKEEEIDGKIYIRLLGGSKLFDSEAAGGESADEDASKYYMVDNNLVSVISKVVKEDEVYVRTPATVYAGESGPEIASFAPKGSALKVTGYDKLLPDGRVNKYRVSYSEGESTKEGFVYGRYTVQSKEDADAVYKPVYKKVKNDNYGYNLYGGRAADLDYYPYERVSIEGNEFCSDARAMYINGAAAVNPGSYVKLIKSTKCNAVVIDIKDGYITYKSKVAKKLSPKSYKTAYASVKDFKKGVDAYRETGAYLIGRIVVFNDPLYAKDHPEDCIKYGSDRGWPSAFSRNVWEYNVKLAIEAAREFGFNEIQFDYVRFPESSYEMSKSKKADFKNAYDEEKGQAVQNFCMYARDMLHEEGVYMSVDVFGESAYGYMTAYGQYWTGISNVVDAISAMPYTDHMGSDGSWETPYKTMLAWSKKAKKQQDKLETPAAARTWITGYNTPHWNPTVDYNAKKLKDQVKALEKAGLSGGFIPWNASSDLSKYRQYKSIWD